MEDAVGLTRPLSGRHILIWGAVLAVGLGLALLVAPLAFDALRALGWVREDAFPKVLRRVLLVPIVATLLFGVRPWRDGPFSSYGLTGPTARPRLALVGAAACLGVCLVILALHFAAGWLSFEDPLRWGELARRAALYVAGGAIVGIVEEYFFRGWLFRRIHGDFGGRGVAAVLTAVAFALTHAFRPSGLDVQVTPDAAGGLEALGSWFSRLANPSTLGPSLLGLFLLSLLLQAAYLRTGTLWTAIGIHAAGAWILHVYGAVTERNVERTWAGSKWLYDGWPAWVLMGICALVLWPWGRRVRSTPAAP